jgi:hypothetical protein
MGEVPWRNHGQPIERRLWVEAATFLNLIKFPMTERERQNANKQVLDLVDEQVVLVESELARIGTLQEDLHAAREAVGRLGLENKRIRDNVDGLSKSKRVSKLQDNAAAISLEENDALMIERSIEAAKAHVIGLGRGAKSSASEVLWALSTARRVSARDALERLLDFSLVGAAGEKLEDCARPVLALKDLQYFFGHSETLKAPDYQIALLHQLRENFSQVRAMCETEPSLAIPPITVVKPAEVAVAEYEPAGGNRLGTLAQAVAA